jgi:hypothetical protein
MLFLLFVTYYVQKLLTTMAFDGNSAFEEDFLDFVKSRIINVTE